jgi:hypothetical protein
LSNTCRNKTSYNISYWRGEGAKRGTRQDRGQMCRKEEVREGVPWQFSIEVTYVVASLVSACCSHLAVLKLPLWGKGAVFEDFVEG